MHDNISHKISFYLFFFCCMVGTRILGQTSPAEVLIDTHVSGPVTVCSDAIQFTIEITNLTSSDLHNVKLMPGMREGMKHAGTQQGMSLTTGDELTFLIGTIAANSTKTVSFDAKADCSLISYVQSPGTASNLINNDTRISHAVGENTITIPEPSGSESYNVLYPEIEIFVPPSDKNIAVEFINVVKNRHITIKNSGLGSLKQFDFFLKRENEMWLDKLELQSSSGNVTLVRSGGTLLDQKYTINNFTGIGDGDDIFEEGEEINLIDYVAAVTSKASIETIYTIQWGCDGDTCNEGESQASFTVYLEAIGGQPNITETYEILKYTDFCNDTPARISYKYTNIGSGNSPNTRDGAFGLAWIYRELGFKTTPNHVFYLQHEDNSLLELTGTFEEDESTNSDGNLYVARVYNFDLNNKFSIDPDGAGGIEDLDQDGFFDDLAPGSTIKFQAHVKNTFTGDIRTMVNGSQSAQLKTTTWSGSTYYANNVQRGFYRRSTTSARLRGPSDIVNSQQHNMQIEVAQGWNTGYFHHNNATYEIVISKPAGVVLTSARYSTRNLDIVEVAEKYVIRDRLLHFPASFTIDLQFAFDCALSVGESKEKIGVDVYLYSDYTCPAARFVVANIEKDVYLHCNNCTTIETTQFKVQRKTLGWEYRTSRIYTYGELFGNNPTAKKVTASTPGINLSGAYVRDEVEAVVKGVVRATSYNNISAQLRYTSPFESAAFNFKSAAFVYNGVTYQLQGVIPEVTVENKQYTYTFSVPLGESLPSVIANGVPFELKILYTVADLVGVPAGNYDVSDFRGTFYAKDASNVSVGCLGYGDDSFQIFKNDFQTKSVATSYYQFEANNKISLGSIYFITYLNGGEFPNEFRPLNYLTNYTVTLPKGFIFDTSKPIETNLSLTFFSGFDGISYSTDRRTVTFNLTDNMPITSFPYLFSYAYVKVDCSNPENTFVPVAPQFDDTRLHPVSFTVKEFAYLPSVASHTNSSHSYNLGMLNYRRPYLKLTADSEQEAYSEVVKWPVQLANTPVAALFKDAQHTWLAFELKANDDKTILQEARDINGNVLPVEFYGPQDSDHPNGRHMFVQLGTLKKANTVQVEVIGRYKNCQENLIQDIDVYASWDYHNYPDLSRLRQTQSTNITSISQIKECEGNLLKEQMFIKYKTGALQWNVAKGGPDVVNLCEPVPFEIDLTSTKYADMSQIKVWLDLPPSISLDASSSIMFQYPFGSEARPIPAGALTTENGKPVIDVTQLVGGNLPGTRTTVNKLRLALNLVAVCGFDPGLPVKFRVTGFTNCGEPVSFNDQRKIRLSGFELDELALSMSASAEQKCKESNDISVIITNNGTLPMGANKLEVTLPQGVQYTNMVQSDIGDPVWGTDNILRWDLPSGYLAAGQSKTFVFASVLNETPPGSTSITFLARTLETGNASCAADNQSCVTQGTSGSGELVVPVTGLSSLDISYEKYVCAYQFKGVINEGTECTLSSYVWDFGDGSTSTAVSPVHAFNPGTYTVSLTTTFYCDGCGGTKTKQLALTVTDGAVTVEEMVINITTEVKKQVIQVSSATFSDAWPLGYVDDNLIEKNSYVNGSQGVWRNDGTYVYQQPRGISAVTNVAIDGTFELEQFNWQHAELSGIRNWTKANSMTQYSPFSYELENRDVLGVYSSALYDYGGNLPSANGVNMRNSEMAFTSFEFLDAGNVTGNWVFGVRPLPTYTFFDVEVGLKNVAVVKVPLAQLDGIDKVDVIAKGIFSVFGIKSVYIQDNVIVCKQVYPENPAWSVIVLERSVNDGLWLGQLRFKNPEQMMELPDIDDKVFHTGKSSLRVAIDKVYKQSLLKPEQDKSYTVSAWVSVGRLSVTTPVLAPGVGYDILVKNKDGQLVATFPFTPQGKIIEGWQQVKGTFVCPVADASVEIRFKSATSGIAWYDDLRFHPEKGNMKSYVYDLKDYRLRAILDEENFASLFYYDQEGNLYLTKKETEDGIKTLTENISYQVQRGN